MGNNLIFLRNNKNSVEKPKILFCFSKAAVLKDKTMVFVR
ncbi:hypothetical protein HMPREF9419_0045 [Prevotella nigrescens ATCC 33563]|nr:hypothetical protein HMPREF9419_0045 [Prevotella nigrescens ATCC 33563]